MTKTFCDRCGKEIKEPKIKLRHWTPYKRILSFYELDNEAEIQLCEDCEKDFRDWLIEKGHVIIGWK